jgi:hypothetical protein
LVILSFYNYVDVVFAGQRSRFVLILPFFLLQASAWLNISKDPIHGNDKKSDSFWGQITENITITASQTVLEIRTN